MDCTPVLVMGVSVGCSALPMTAAADAHTSEECWLLHAVQVASTRSNLETADSQGERVREAHAVLDWCSVDSENAEFNVCSVILLA